MGYCIEHLPSRLSIGRETETGVTDIRIDCTDWLERWPGMTVAAIFCPPGGTPYILDTEMSGNSLVWHVRDTDTATPGIGQLELTGEADGKRKLSALVDVQVARRLPGTAGDVPDPAQPWVDSVLGAAERITGMQVATVTLGAGSGATAEWDGEQGLLTIGVPKGAKGEKGEKGDTGEQGPKGVPGADGKDAVVDATLTQSGQAADAKVTGDAICQLKGDLAANSAADEETRRKLDCLWKLNHGISYQFDTDDSVAYSKTVPTGAKLASVEAVGGKTVVWNQGVTKAVQAIVNATATGSGFLYASFPKNAYKMKLLHKHTYMSIVNLSVETDHSFENGYQYGIGYGTGGSFSNDITSRPFESGKDSVCLFQAPDSSEGSVISVRFWTKPTGAGGTYCTIQSNYIYMFDLTVMFGFGNEPTSTDDPRIAWVAKYAAEHPEYNAGELISADVESVKHHDVVVTEIPEEVRNLYGYGWAAGSVYNSIERTETGWQYVQRVGEYVFDGTENWIVSDVGYCYFTNKHFDNGLQSDNANFLTNVEGEYRVIRVRSDGNGIIARYSDSSAKLTLDEIKSRFSSGKILHYEYKTPIITDITDLMVDFPAYFDVEPGGTITMENAAMLPVPSTEKYLIAMAEVNQ